MSHLPRLRISGWLVAAFAGPLIALFATVARASEVDLPAGTAENALRTLSIQSGTEIVFATDVVTGVPTPAVKGNYSALEAAGMLLAGTDLMVTRDEQTGAIMVNNDRGAKAAPRVALSGVPAGRLAALTRGVNLGHWFSAEAYDHERLRDWIAVDEFDALARAGFRHVRFPIEFEMFFDPNHPSIPKPDYLADLDVALDRILGSGLAVVVDFHAKDRTKDRLRDSDALVADYAELWGAIARHLGTRDPNRVFLELMNEPPGEKEMPLARWLVIQSRFLAAVRAAAPGFTVIVTANGWDGIPQLAKTTPLPDPDLVYTFHFYDPIFTRQGASWAKGEDREIRGLEYPVDPDNRAAVAAKVANPKVRSMVEGYHSTRETLAARIAVAVRWAHRYRVPLYAGEFGVYQSYAPEDGRMRWIRDVRELFEENGIDWCMWDYCAGFGVAVGDTPGQRTLDPACLKALGL